MEKEVKVTTLEDEDGNSIELEVIKEFNYKDKKYAVLYEKDGCPCECDEECDEDCDCGCQDEDEFEGHIYILEATEDKDGKDEYTEVDPSLREELVSVAEKELYPTEE